MKAKTRLFGEIDIAEEKIIVMEGGMIGFPELRRFALIFDEEKEHATILWMQSMDDPDIAFPVIDPSQILEDYNPAVNEEILSSLGELSEENRYVLNTITVPRNIERMAVNLKAPIVINTNTCRGRQIIVEDDYPVKYAIYQLLKKNKERAGD